eukprot:CAMPEP_0204554998 /NCGR_PEP_ID=MMETSP0661-20131031/28523_1 /ASSEMBLY_ACC=CAM_ASM_000606 /TAXON_ID=109239 /ORGANISM="Alexandrium margalefi, Strain AMGDE01CS-322" /LENGTH=109 /DNA_ID=CAMNT_0051562083 /DNA_START=45 /DNA_END=372 /DNA_ORIENTATION=+
MAAWWIPSSTTNWTGAEAGRSGAGGTSGDDPGEVRLHDLVVGDVREGREALGLCDWVQLLEMVDGALLEVLPPLASEDLVGDRVQVQVAELTAELVEEGLPLTHHVRDR